MTSSSSKGKNPGVKTRVNNREVLLVKINPKDNKESLCAYCTTCLLTNLTPSFMVSKPYLMGSFDDKYDSWILSLPLFTLG